MFNLTMVRNKHLMQGATVTLGELATISGLVVTTVSVQPSGNRFSLAFDTAADLHTASIILSAIRSHEYWEQNKAER